MVNISITRSTLQQKKYDEIKCNEITKKKARDIVGPLLSFLLRGKLDFFAEELNFNC